MVATQVLVWAAKDEMPIGYEAKLPDMDGCGDTL